MGTMRKTKMLTKTSSELFVNGGELKANVPTYTILAGGKVKFTSHPTQKQLVEFANKHRDEVTSIVFELDQLDDDGWNYVDRLDFQSIGCLPHLTELLLSDVNLKSIDFTEENTPNLKVLALFAVLPSGELKLNLDLPHLEVFHAEHTMLDEEAYNAFGLSMSRCPKLKKIHTFKFRSLAGHNYMVLPSCEELLLHKSDRTVSLEILHAPKLRTLVLAGSYDLHHLRLHDLRVATPHDVQLLCAKEELCEAEAKAQMVAERKAAHARRARDGKRKVKDEDLPDSVLYRLNSQYEKVIVKGQQTAWSQLLDALAERTALLQSGAGEDAVDLDEPLPRIELEKSGMEFDEATHMHLREHHRVTILQGTLAPAE